MSTTIAIGVSAYSVSAAKSTTYYGQLAKLPMRTAYAGALFQASLAKIPKNATIVSAFVRFHGYGAVTGTRVMRVSYVTGTWPSKPTYAKRPTLSATVGSKSLRNPKHGAAYDIPVTATVQAMVSGSLPNKGWYITSSETATTYLHGSGASGGRPSLHVTYTVPPPAPTGLEPSNAAVATSKPTLLFAADPNILGLQVQVDPAANATAPAFDSGDVAASGGMLDLADTTYAGLAPGASTWWRARQRTDGGWGPWSSWVTFTYDTTPALTITSPPAAPDADGYTPIGDGTPPIAWTFAGTQVAWRVRLFHENGDVLADSQYTAGTDTDWTPPTGLARDGQTALIQVEVWDNVERAATPGNPVQAIATLPVILSPDLAAAPFTDVTATGDWFDPLVTVSGRRSVIPDQVALTRDGTEVGRWVGTDLAVADPGGGFRFTVTDPAAVVGRSQTWRLVPITNGTRGPGGAGAALVPTAEGIWLSSVDDPTQRVVLFGTDAGQEQPETAVVHQPIGDGVETAVVRRRLIRSKPQGAIAGTIANTARTNALELENRLRGWVADDAGSTYWLQLGGYTGRVIIGDVTFSEAKTRPSSGRVVNVAFSWWAQ
jgi:hypothetical protein